MLCSMANRHNLVFLLFIQFSSDQRICYDQASMNGFLIVCREEARLVAGSPNDVVYKRRH